MSWTAILPLKLGGERKSRLAPRLTPDQRVRLSDHMAAIVLHCLRTSPLIRRVILLAPVTIPGDAEWRRDEGRGLNAELTALRAGLGDVSLLVVHGDLPLLAPQDIDALVAAADKGCALAPDRHGSGTNALAVAQGFPLDFAFGVNSCALHRQGARGKATVVRRPGLMMDIDTTEDLDAAMVAGFRFPDLVDPA